ncbi:MAG TPA: serine hydrolase domain-containing protein [Ramlibacter sp.]|jgi:CubicO group peptidase (beta-lactamase class C family)|uniref:serine hydrolase domain-containing protein n=1 Tax=Ramlibacter sp. TaxID=1917967 RepID=UPI002D6514F9|nr:serine hydrolase domain-containing protein [Ramlibacter sp.]HZY18142.1 serine hydrolase domain-containing protein [Ramlibacter sp.]
MSVPAAPLVLQPSADLDESLQPFLQTGVLAGVSYAVLRGRDVVATNCLGWADQEAQVPLRPDHLFRVFSNTKLVTACAVLRLVEDGRLGLDDPVERHLPRLADRRVLRPGATSLDDTEPARRPLQVRDLLTHASGIAATFIRPDSLLARAYTERRVQHPRTTLAQTVDLLADLPLQFHPGEAWSYSTATDVAGRIVEVVSGRPFDAFLREQVFGPLAMVDTGFVVPPGEAHRLVAHYRGSSEDPASPVRRADELPYPRAYLQPVPRLSAAGGLVSTLGDMVALVRSLVPGGPTLLQPQTLALLPRNQLAPGVFVEFPDTGPLPHLGHGLAGAVTLAVPEGGCGAVGDYQWGGASATHWLVSPGTGLAMVLMTQRFDGFWDPFWNDFRQAAFGAWA